MIAAEASLAGWIPFRVRLNQLPPSVQWCYLGERTFAEPFFEDTVRQCLAKPFNQLFARETTIEAMRAWSAAAPGLAPTAFIFHTSRCGSTLFSQLAAALPRTVVVSEAPPIDEVLRATAPESERVEWLRVVLSVLGQPRRGDERHLFVKFDAWHVIALPLIRRAFPDVPLVFLYREPAEVIASQMRMPGVHMIPGQVDPALMGLDLPAALQLSREEYCARVLRLVYEAAVAHARRGELSLLNYSDLPAAAERRLLEWCGLSATEEIRERLRRVTEFDAKTPSLPYDPTDVKTRPAPSRETFAAADRHIGPFYRDLESIRNRNAVSFPLTHKSD